MGPLLAQEQGYVNTADQQQRSAISGMGQDPFTKAASKMSPSSYAVSPTNTASFGAPPPPPQNAFAPPPGGPPPGPPGAMPPSAKPPMPAGTPPAPVGTS